MTSEEAAVHSKFSDLLTHMGSLDGVNAIGGLLPVFIASLLHDAPDPSRGLKELCSDVLRHVEAINALHAMGEGHGNTLQ